jgi:hypothetical protein
LKEIVFLPDREYLKKYVLANYLMGEWWFFATTDNVTEAGVKAKATSADIFEKDDCVEKGVANDEEQKDTSGSA